jgi:hypothetical protein
MSNFLRTQLMIVLLLVTVLLAPFNSCAHDATSGASDLCACHQLPADCGAGGDQPDGSPDNDGPTCCDCEDHCQQTAEPAIFGTSRLNIPGKQLYPPTTRGLAPEVYLAIFVPPQNYSSR